MRNLQSIENKALIFILTNGLNFDIIIIVRKRENMQILVKSPEFDTQEIAEQKMGEYYRNYHPAGYGTSLRLQKAENGKWSFSGYRYDSCD